MAQSNDPLPKAKELKSLGSKIQGGGERGAEGGIQRYPWLSMHATDLYQTSPPSELIYRILLGVALKNKENSLDNIV